MKVIDWLLAPESVQLIITNNCFLQCEFCVEPLENDNKQIKGDISKIEKAVELLRKWGVKEITITGGEPTMVHNFDKILAKSKNCGFITSLATNGVRVTDNILNKLAPQIDVLKLSLYGNRLVHDKIVGFEGAFNRVVLTLEKSFKLNNRFQIEVTCVVVKDNLDAIGEVLDVCLKYKVNKLTLNEIFRRGKGKDYNKAIPINQIYKIRNRLLLEKKERIIESGIKIVIRPASPSCVLVYPTGKIEIGHIPGEKNGLYNLGNIFKDDIGEAWINFPYKKRFMENFRAINI